MKKTLHCPACGAKAMTEVDRDTRKKYFHCSSCASKFSLAFNMEKIKLTEKAIKEYLDKAIKLWRGKRKEAEENSEDELIARCYIDAFQSVRTSLFNELLKDEKVE